MARRSRRSRRQDESRGFVWMLVGLGLGLLVAVGVYLSDLRVSPDSGTPASAGTAAPAPSASSERAAPPPVPRQTGDAAVANEAPEEKRFDFYDILPQYEVVVPEVEVVTRRSLTTPTAPVAAPGSYVLQTGSFRSHNDADRMQASLALLGIESRIQKVTIDEDVFHRVRVGPVDDLEELDRIRAQLRSAGVEPLMMKVTE